MSRINEKIVSDIRAKLSDALKRNVDEVIASKGFRRMLEHINDDEEFRERMENSVKLAIEILDKVKLYDFSVLDRKGLGELLSSIDLVKGSLEGIASHEFFGDETDYTIDVVDSFDSLDKRIGYLRNDIKALEKAGSRPAPE